ncbi:unnamed protein product [Caretta caretta]
MQPSLWMANRGSLDPAEVHLESLDGETKAQRGDWTCSRLMADPGIKPAFHSCEGCKPERKNLIIKEIKSSKLLKTWKSALIASECLSEKLSN